MPHLFGEKLRYLRETWLISQAALGRELGGISRGHVHNLEVGHKAPSIELIFLLMDFFEVSAAYLLLDSLEVNRIVPLDKNFLGGTLSQFKELLPQKLLYLRQRDNLALSDLALRLDLAVTSRSYLANIEAGRQLPSLSLLVRIAEVFGVSIDYLLKGAIVPIGHEGEGKPESTGSA